MSTDRIIRQGARTGFALALLASSCLTASCTIGASGRAPSHAPPGRQVGADDAPESGFGRHVVRLTLGVQDWSVDSDVSGGGASSTAGSDGFAGALGYDSFTREDLALGISVGVLDGETSTAVGPTGTSSSSASVVHILLGVTYYPEALRIGQTLRPWVSGSAGPYIGASTNSQTAPVVSSETVTETVLGARLAAGIDWHVGRQLKLGLTFGYHLVEEFDQLIGNTDDYSGAEVSLLLGLHFGRPVHG